jgi:hypothetical protein
MGRHIKICCLNRVFGSSEVRARLLAGFLARCHIKVTNDASYMTSNQLMAITKGIALVGVGL